MKLSSFLRRQSINLTLLFVGVAMALSGYAFFRQGEAVQEACKIQQRGLVANRHLTAFFVDWDRLITLQRQQQARSLLKEPAVQRRITQDAIAEIHAFAAIQQRQPAKRSCP